jgi:beta-lactamase superfamily II metal-dependent hydrolase
MRRSIAIIFVLCLAAFLPVAQAQTAKKTLDIYVIDVEGGNATLFVGPSGQSVLIDTGNAGAAAERDSGRIMDAAKDAGLTRIDHLITTHWHGDHFGGMSALAAKIPIQEYIDHGPDIQVGSNKMADEFLANTYPELYGKSKHTVAKPGDTIPMTGVQWHIVSAARQMIKTPLPGAGEANPYCSEFQPMEADGGIENSASVGSVIVYGKFRMAHLGDLTWNMEKDLMCPVDRIGHVDLWIVSHHGLPVSSSHLLVWAIHPRVAILNNGTRKGAVPQTMETLFKSPGLEDIWQMHFSVLGGQEYTVPGMFIANTIDDQPDTMPIAPSGNPMPGPGMAPPPAHNGKAYWIKASALPDGTFTVTNPRNGFSKTYKAMAK